MSERERERVMVKTEGTGCVDLQAQIDTLIEAGKRLVDDAVNANKAAGRKKTTSKDGGAGNVEEEEDVATYAARESMMALLAESRGQILGHKRERSR